MRPPITSLPLASLIFALACPSSGTSTPPSEPSDAPAPIVEAEPEAQPSGARARDWTDEPAVTEVDGKQCNIYREVAVLVDDAGITFAAAEDAPGCVMPRTATRVDLDDRNEFRGVIGDQVAIVSDLGSEFSVLLVLDLAGETAYSTPDVPPGASLTIDAAAGELVYGFTIDHPCPDKPQDRACWSRVQSEHPALANEDPPGFDCGPDPDAFQPYIVLHAAVPLDNLKATPSERLPLAWGCH